MALHLFTSAPAPPRVRLGAALVVLGIGIALMALDGVSASSAASMLLGASMLAGEMATRADTDTRRADWKAAQVAGLAACALLLVARVAQRLGGGWL